MLFKYTPGSLTEALEVIANEGLEDLTNYETMQLAMELLKVSAISNAAEDIDRTAWGLRESL